MAETCKEHRPMMQKAREAWEEYGRAKGIIDPTARRKTMRTLVDVATDATQRLNDHQASCPVCKQSGTTGGNPETK